MVEAQPVVVRISAAKRLRDAAECAARRQGVDVVTTDQVPGAREVEPA
jgi:chlorophyllide a reductase subunit Z